LALTLALALAPVSLSALDGVGDARVTRMATDLKQPWSVGFLPDGSVLITERGGRLWHLRDGKKHEVRGVGPVLVTGQGGLLDILVPRDFAQTRQLYFTHAVQQADGSGTALATARLSEDSQELTDWQVLFQIAPGSDGGRHFGSRLVEAPDGHLFMTVGERGDRPSAQDLSRENGSVLRLTRQGTPAPGNPFVDTEGARPAIWSYGHRNPQGAALDAEGQLWITEHGAKGGDEVNSIQRGANYGWPEISYGRHYSGFKIGRGTEAPGMEQPEFYWDPSIAPSGLMIYSGRLWPEWRGQLFAGSLKFDHIARLGGSPMSLLGQISGPQTDRVRDVREGPEGGIWFLSEGAGALYRIMP
jgi:glucose/arabinose dehydrogenase